MATCNGAAYLPAQLDSIAAQTVADWTLRVSDDGSTDGTREVLRDFARRHEAGRVEVVDGPRRGFVANFLSLACDPGGAADYFAFCDQDDVWLPGKLERAIGRLEGLPRDMPLLYCGRTRLIDGDGREIGLSPLYSRPPAFGNALVQNIGGGNTMVFNEAARRLLAEAGADVRVPYHDWWLYLLVSGCGGTVVYDEVPMVGYRQHRGNLVGDRTVRSDAAGRVRSLWQRRFGRSLDAHAQALRAMEGRLAPASRETFERFERVRRLGGPFARLRALRRLGIHRQRPLEDLALLALAFFGKI